MLSFLLALTLAQTAQAETVSKVATNKKLEANKKVVVDFYNMTLNEHKPAEAVKLFVGPMYRQHNPFAGDGTGPFIKFFEERFQKTPGAKSEIKRVIAEGDLVVLHVHAKDTPEDRGRAIIDIFRVEKGKVVEHWDVVQPIPEQAANTNTMF